jgi:penicillin-insensitive murein endopeptidase
MRIGCQPGSPGCKGQEATPADDGCGKPLAWWFTDEPWRPSKNPDAPKARDLMTMANLPRQCQAVLDAPGPASAEAVTYRGGRSPTAAAPAIAQAAPEQAADTPFLPAGASAFTATPQTMPLPLARPRN